MSTGAEELIEQLKAEKEALLSRLSSTRGELAEAKRELAEVRPIAGYLSTIALPLMLDRYSMKELPAAVERLAVPLRKLGLIPYGSTSRWPTPGMYVGNHRLVPIQDSGGVNLPQGTPVDADDDRKLSSFFNPFARAPTIGDLVLITRAGPHLKGLVDRLVTLPGLVVKVYENSYQHNIDAVSFQAVPGHCTEPEGDIPFDASGKKENSWRFK